MDQRLKLFKYKQTLDQNVTERRIFLLGEIEKQQGEAILILQPKLITPQQLKFSGQNLIFQNDIYRRYEAELNSSYQIQLIFPITEKHKKKYIQKLTTIIKETKQMYEKDKESMLARELKHIDWVKNIVKGKSQVQRVLVNCDEFIILPDFKYTDITDTNNLHLLLIFKQQQLTSIRDLNEGHIQLLEKAQKSIENLLSEKFKLQNQCRIYFHYPPTFYRLHLHIMNIKLSAGSSIVQRCHQISTVIDNLKIKGSYYKEARLNTFKQVLEKK